jgi:prepilin signal peptidase PulO-like enzyme (type II secretory pathway)
VEIITPLIFISLFWKFGTNLILFGKYVILFVFLIPIFFIDLYHRLILDKLTIPMAIIGLGFALVPNTDVKILNAFLTGLGIMAVMLLIAWLFEKIKKVDGMGGGDIKLLAAMATFLGAINISFIVLFASVIAVIVAAAFPKTREHGIPYGPFLAVSTFFWLLFGNYFLEWYFSLIL